MVTGTSVLGVKYDGGVMIAADTLGMLVSLRDRYSWVRQGTDLGPDALPNIQPAWSRISLIDCALARHTAGSYGSMAKFRQISRMHKVNNQTVMAATGDYADFQYIVEDLTELQYVCLAALSL